jgi:hypothetical protein
VSRPRASAAARRTALTTVALLSLAATALLTAGPAAADEPNKLLGPTEGADLSSGISTGEALLLLIGGPLLILLAITALVWLPGMVRSERYRPGRSWTAAPVWFAGPREPVAAVEAVTAAGTAGTTAGIVRGGASGSW